MKNCILDPVVPTSITGENDLEDLIALKEKTGIHRFLEVGVYNGVRITGYPSDDDFRDFAEKLRDFKERAAPHGIEIGWWCLPTLKLGKSPYQPIVDISGKESPISSCPLNEKFAADFVRRVKIVLETARPGMMLLEDDFQLSNHPGFRLGCFCPEHLKLFARYAGREYSREELEKIFTEKPLRQTELRRLWAKLSHDTMVEFSGKIRAAADEVSPETRIWLCEPGTTDLDGGLSEDLPRALAGKNTVPAIRIFGTQYGSSDIGREIPYNMAHAMYSAEHLPENFEIFHESDTYPHNRFFSSAALMRSIMTGAMMIGCDNSLFIGGQYLDRHFEETGYFDMYRDNLPRFLEIQRIVREGELDGCQIIYKPEYDFIRANQPWAGDTAINGLKNCAYMLGRFGIPYTTRERRVKLLCKAAAECMTGDELKKVLSQSVLLDSECALHIQERGLGNLCGVQVRSCGMLPVTEEKTVHPEFISDGYGRKMYNFAYAPSGTEGASYVELRLDGAEKITEYLAPDGKAVQPGLTRYENTLGGRVAVMGCAFANSSSNLYNYRKKAVLHRLLNWLNRKKLPAVALKAPNIWTLCNTNDRRMTVMVNNLSPDPVENLELDLAEKWQNRPVFELNSKGQWKKISSISGQTCYMSPRIFRIDSEDCD